MSQHRVIIKTSFMINLILEELKRKTNYPLIKKIINFKLIDLDKIFKEPIEIRTKSGIIITISRNIP